VPVKPAVSARPYLPQLDGLRGIAILGVLAFHFNLSEVGWAGLGFQVGFFELGWTGVTLFFVLSGYLITEILLATRDEPRYFRNFYARRALRIFPAYYLMLILAYRAAQDLATTPDPRVGSIDEWPFYVFYLSNYWLGAHAFHTPMSPLLGLSWTLSVEEQFYLLWPFIVRALKPRALAALCAALIVASPLLRWGLLHLSGNPLLTQVSLSSNFESLALGGLIAVLRYDPDLARWTAPRIGFALAVVSGLALAALFGTHGLHYFADARFWMSGAVGTLFFPALVAIFFSGILTLALASSTPFAGLLSFRPLAALGRISYGVYLYHVLVNFVLTRAFWTDVFLPIPGNHPDPSVVPLLYVARYAVTIAVAAISYRYLETPLLKLKARFA